MSALTDKKATNLFSGCWQGKENGAATKGRVHGCDGPTSKEGLKLLFMFHLHPLPPPRKILRLSGNSFELTNSLSWRGNGNRCHCQQQCSPHSRGSATMCSIDTCRCGRCHWL